MKTIILASNNSSKLKEIQFELKNLHITLKSQSEFRVKSIPEIGLTFVENALLKARHAARECNLPALADDSGLVVDALRGEPGIYSARYAGEAANDKANIDKLLQALIDMPIEQRQAYFYCCIVYLRHADDPTPIIAEGRWSGIIRHDAEGENGFGYDPIFYLPELQKTVAELTMAEKNKMSHRGQAVRIFKEKYC